MAKLKEYGYFADPAECNKHLGVSDSSTMGTFYILFDARVEEEHVMAELTTGGHKYSITGTPGGSTGTKFYWALGRTKDNTQVDFVDEQPASAYEGEWPQAPLEGTLTVSTFAGGVETYPTGMVVAKDSNGNEMKDLPISAADDINGGISLPNLWRFLDKYGLEHFYDRIAAIFLDKAEVDAEIDAKVPIATTAVAGKVKPDGTTITINEDGTIAAAIGDMLTKTEAAGTYATKESISDMLTNNEAGQVYATKAEISDMLTQTKAAETYATKAEISAVYTPKGSCAIADLPVSAEATVGDVWNITDGFTTDERFVEGAGKVYPAGTNVVSVHEGDAYKWDVLSGMVDLSGYATKGDIADMATKTQVAADYATKASVADMLTKTEAGTTYATKTEVNAKLDTTTGDSRYALKSEIPTVPTLEAITTAEIDAMFT